MTQTAQSVRAMCVTAFIAPQSLIALPVYSDGSAVPEYQPPVIAVGTYLSNRAIVNISYFHNAEKAMKYAFVLKAENCPISKNAFALLQAEVKRAKAAAEKEQEKKACEIIKESPLPVAPCKILTEQYEAMKAKHPDAVLLFHCGDFYECFGEDAVTCADILQITLTRRMNGPEKKIELAGSHITPLTHISPSWSEQGRGSLFASSWRSRKPRTPQPRKPTKASKKPRRIKPRTPLAKRGVPLQGNRVCLFSGY